MATATEPENTKQVGYVLPVSLIRRVKLEAVRLGVYPAEVVRRHLERSLRASREQSTD